MSKSKSESGSVQSGMHAGGGGAKAPALDEDPMHLPSGETTTGAIAPGKHDPAWETADEIRRRKLRSAFYKQRKSRAVSDTVPPNPQQVVREEHPDAWDASIDDLEENIGTSQMTRESDPNDPRAQRPVAVRDNRVPQKVVSEKKKP